MQFTFSEPPVWNTDALNEPTHEPSLLWVNLSSMKLRDEVPITSVPSTSSMPLSSMHPTMKYPCRQLPTWLQSYKNFCHGLLLTLQTKPQGILPQGGCHQSLQDPDPPSEEEGSQWSGNMDSATPALTVTLMPSDDPCASTFTPAFPILPAPKTMQVVSVSPIHQPKTSLQPKPPELSKELLWLQEKLTAALEHLLTVRTALNLHWWELDLQVELSRLQNDAQFNEAIREAMACQLSTAVALKEAYKSNVMVLDWEAKVEEGRECQAFAEAFLPVIWMCLPETHGTFMYPPQLLTSDVPLAALMGMTTMAQLQAMEGIMTTPKTTPTVPVTSAAPSSGKCWW